MKLHRVVDQVPVRSTLDEIGVLLRRISRHGWVARASEPITA